jgi:hypothetical protein
MVGRIGSSGFAPVACTSCSHKLGWAAVRSSCNSGHGTPWQPEMLITSGSSALQGRPTASEELAWEAAVRGPLLVSILEAYRAVSSDAWRVELT